MAGINLMELKNRFLKYQNYRKKQFVKKNQEMIWILRTNFKLMYHQLLIRIIFYWYFSLINWMYAFQKKSQVQINLFKIFNFEDAEFRCHIRITCRDLMAGAQRFILKIRGVVKKWVSISLPKLYEIFTIPTSSIQYLKVLFLEELFLERMYLGTTLIIYDLYFLITPLFV